MKIVIFLILFISSLFSSNEFEYYIQVGSTKNKSTLDEFISIATKNEIKYYIKTKDIKGKLYYRFLVGPYLDKDLAQKELEALKELFQNRSSYISRFHKKTIEIDKIKKLGYEAYLNRDFSSMNKYLEEAAVLGDKESIYYIAKNYHNGIGIKQDISKAIFWYEKCLFDKRCLMGLGNIYLDYNLEEKPDLKKAFYYFQEASKKGSKKAKVLIENQKRIEKTHTLLQEDKIESKLVETLFYQNIKSSKIQNLQLVNSYAQDNAININITLILNGKLKDAFMRIKKSENGYWKVLEFKIY